MNPRLSALKRIEGLYAMVEEMHSVMLRQATARVHEAEAAIDWQYDQMRQAANDGRQALVEGDRQQWLLAGTQQELGSVWCQQLEAERYQRKIATDQARVDFSASRIKSKQMKSIIDKTETEEELVAGRKAQTTTDDRFLSRLRWNALRFEET